MSITVIKQALRGIGKQRWIGTFFGLIGLIGLIGLLVLLVSLILLDKPDKVL
jgi:hypothetical protein